MQLHLDQRGARASARLRLTENMARYPDWSTIKNFLTAGTPLRVPIQGTPPISLLIDPNAPKLAILLPFPTGARSPSTDLEIVELSSLEIDGKPFLQMATRQQLIFEEFFSLITSVADLVQLRQASVVDAIHQRIDAWRALLKSASLLSEDRQLGLIGELWLLTRLLRCYGPPALESWIGPLGEPHDFRRNDIEFEVKSTRNVQRLHIISSLQQLLPSPDRKLFILSLQFEPTSGASGRTLPEAVGFTRALLQSDTVMLKQFDDLALSCGYFAKHTPYYKTRYQFRTVPTLVPVDESCPRLTPHALSCAVSNDLATRISDVQYRINLENMGFDENSEEFNAMLPLGTES